MERWSAALAAAQNVPGLRRTRAARPPQSVGHHHTPSAEHMVHTYTPAPERSTGFCFNSSDCPWPQQCLAESRTRRYCADGPLDAVYGRSLFDLSDERAPGLFHCERCDSPLVNIDFGSPIDAGANRCITECRLPVGSANATHVEPILDQWGQYSTNLFTTEACAVIAAHPKTQPLFMYLPYEAVHGAASCAVQGTLAAA